MQGIPGEWVQQCITWEPPMRRRDVLAVLTNVPIGFLRTAETDEVDLLLILAVDVSGSINRDEAWLQREGHCRGLVDPKVLAAVQSGVHGAIGVAFVEWAEAGYQRLVIPWTRISSAPDAAAWSLALANAQQISGEGTSISGSIEFSRHVMAEAPWKAARRVIDISGDGKNSDGAPVQEARDRAVAAGITINGLAVENDGRGNIDLFDGSGSSLVGTVAEIGAYYLAEVIGGPGAFVIGVDGFPAFGEAVRRKLVREVACRRHWNEDHHQRIVGGDRSILHGSPAVPRLQQGHHVDDGMAEAAPRIA
jgi:hypothetical protein